MKSDRELVSWFQKYVQGFLELTTDLQNGLALISFVEIVAGITIPHCKKPETVEQCYQNCNTALTMIFNLYENLNVNITADDIIQGNITKIRELLDALSSDEWIIEDNRPAEPWVDTFDPKTCDLNLYDIRSILCIQSVFRRYHSQLEFTKLQKQNENRLKILRELQETEELYIKNLEVVVTIYIEPLQFKTRVSTEPFLTATEMAQIFSNIEAIYACNKNFLVELNQRMESLDSYTLIGDIFIEFLPYFRIYTQYYNNYETASALLDKLRGERPLLNDFLTSCVDIPECRGQSLDSFLINPVQRLPRYILLLKELSGRTHHHHPDFKNLCEAIVQVQLLANTLNKKIQTTQAANEVFVIQQKLVGDDIPNIVSPHRLYITEGIFKEFSLDRNKGKDHKKIYAFLFNDIILTTKKITHNVFRYRHVIKLSRPTRIKDIIDKKVIKNAFIITSPVKTLTLSCDTESQKLEWMTYMTQQIAQNLDTSLSRSTLLPSKAKQPLSIMSKTATITGTRTCHDPNGKPFTEYCIFVTTYDRDVNHHIYHRYREFDALAKKLKKQFPYEEFIELPRKHMIHNLTADTVEAREVMLESFLEDILSKPRVRSCDDFVIFLSPSDRYISPSKKKVTKLKQPEHLKKLEQESRKQESQRRATVLKKSKNVRDRPNRTSTMEDILGKMGPLDSLEQLLPSKPSSVQHSPIVAVELESLKSPSVNSDTPVPLKPNTPAPLIPSPVRVVRRPAGRGRGKGRGRNIPRPESPRVIRLKALKSSGEPNEFLNTLNQTIGRNTRLPAFPNHPSLGHSVPATARSCATVRVPPPIPPKPQAFHFGSAVDIQKPLNKRKRRSNSLTRK